METGADLTYSNVAEAASVQERTIYRYFPTKADLEAGLWGWILEHLTHIDLKAKGEEDLIAAMRNSFKGFDDGASLIQAMLHSRQGLKIRQGQQTERRMMFEACIAAAVPEAPPRIRTPAAAALQVLYSASAWETLRSFWGMDAAQAADVVELAIRAMLAGLRLGTRVQDEEPQQPTQPKGKSSPARPVQR
jgi:AcrR family transcriptional regulator